MQANELFDRPNTILLDGGMGTMLQAAGLKLGARPEELNITDPALIESIHARYAAAGSRIINANTFGASAHKLAGSEYTLEEIIAAGIANCKRACAPYGALAALDVGPLGELLEPNGTLAFEDAVAEYGRIVRAGVAAGADLVFLETFTDLYELKAALLAVKENSSLPVLASMSFEAGGRTFTGCTVESFAATARGLGADAVGINCSLGPKEIFPMAKRLTEALPGSFPVFVKPNAGLPRADGSGYDITPQLYAMQMKPYRELGLFAAGGCCGTTPEFIQLLNGVFADCRPGRPDHPMKSVVCSPMDCVDVDGITVVGERINPTGKKRFQQALREGDMNYVLEQAVSQTEAGAQILDVNVGAPGVDEPALMEQVVKALQSVVSLPLQLDSSNVQALENGLRVYNGKPIVNSTNGEPEKLRAILPLCKKYGAAVVGLAIDERGILPKAEDRVAIARRIRDAALAALRDYWDEKCAALQIDTPNEGMNTLINIWTLYQSEINVQFSRFASFIEVGGRTGLGYRDTAQDAMTVLHSNPARCKERIVQLLKGLVSEGYGLHLFEPEWFEETPRQSFKSPTVVPTPDKSSMIHGLADACSDDALWLVSTVADYVRETGDAAFLDMPVPYADKGTDTVYGHLKTILDFSQRMVGAHGICQGLRADWNDCLNLGGGESAMVSFLHVWALGNFAALARWLGRKADAEHYEAVRRSVADVCEKELWDGRWYLRGFTKNGRPIGTDADTEGKVHLESNTWAVLSGAAGPERGARAMDSVEEYLYTPWGLMLNAPAYSKPDDDIGFVTRVYKGLKENGSIFSHPNPWAWAAECVLGRGDRAMQFYDALCPYWQNDKIETRKAEPYSYCQFITGRDHKKFGEAHHPFMTGSGGWSYVAATRYMLGIRPEFDGLVIDPCIPGGWDGFTAVRRFRGAVYEIEVRNPAHVCKGVKALYLDGVRVERLPLLAPGTTGRVTAVLG